MNSFIFPTKQETEFFTPERCHIIEVFNQSKISSFSIAQARVKPEVQTQLHALKETDETYYILNGEGEMEIDGTPVGIVRKGDVVYIPKGKSQRIKNISSEDLIFLCVCSPRFKVETYENLE